MELGIFETSLSLSNFNRSLTSTFNVINTDQTIQRIASGVTFSIQAHYDNDPDDIRLNKMGRLLNLPVSDGWMILTDVD